MDIYTIDAETFYDKEFSLSKLTAEEYIRDERFEVIMWGIKKNDEPSYWITGDYEQIKYKLIALRLDQAMVIMHNSLFDAAILNWEYGIKPKRIVDTLCMARALVGQSTSVSLSSLAKHFKIGEKGTEVVNALGKRREDFSPYELGKYGDYCCNDVDLTYELFKKMAEDFPLQEYKLIDLTIRMFSEPTILLDTSGLTEHLEHVRRDKQQALEAIYDECVRLGCI